jgi:hypothetical protein
VPQAQVAQQGEAVTNDAQKPANDVPSRIAGLPSFAEMSSTIALVKVLEKWLPRVAPLAKLFGVDVDAMESALSDATKLVPQLEQHIGLPDRFNALYVPLGWVAYGGLGHQVMIDAVAAGEQGDLSTGESLLQEYYSSDVLDFQLLRLRGLDSFADRTELAQLSKLDYLERRFHACVPNVLMLIDGFASDVTRNNDSFFSDDADLTAWDSVEGHPTGLASLAALLRTRRTKRRTDPLRIPFRHGILHGRDLGFANKLVAAKCWAALFAVGEWARRVESGKKDPPPPERKLTLMESLRQSARKRESHQRWVEWRPRNVVVGRDLSAVGSPDDYGLGTPERSLVEFLTLWRARNYGGMAKHVTVGAEKVDPRTRAGDISRAYRAHRLERFELRAIDERGPRMVSIATTCFFERTDTELRFLVAYEDDNGDWLSPEWDRRVWRVLNWQCVERLATMPE